MSIKARLLLTISVLIALAFAAIGIVTVTITEARMVERVDGTLVAATGQPMPRSGGFGADHHNEYAKRATSTMLLDANGTVRVFEPSGFLDDPDPLPELPGGDPAERVGVIFTAGASDDSGRHFRVLIHNLGNGQYLAVAAPLDDVDATVRSLTIVIIVTGALVLGAVVLIVWLTIRRGLRPIDDMIHSAGLIAGGDLSHRVEVQDTATEVGQLGRALNEMLGQIETSFAAKEASERRLRQFVADASHELRTPLTSIRGYAELFRSGAATDPKGLERVMARIESEGTRMGKLVEDLLLLARLDQGRPLLREPVDLAPIVEQAVTDARVADPDRQIGLEGTGPAVVIGDADRLRQVVDNLLTNARVHTEPGTPIHVSLAADADRVVLTVADEGAGIAPEDVPHVFDRFYRADPSRSRASGGTGLGLSIVASIVAAHGGEVGLDSTPGQGTTFTITLRCAPAPVAPPGRDLAAVG